MTLICVTGIAGSGKSAALAELKARGQAAYGIDEDGLAYWRNRATHTRLNVPLDRTARAFRAPGFYTRNEWVLDPAAVVTLTTGRPRTIFICGNAGIERHWDLFNAVAYLDVDAHTAIQRLDARTTGNYGKSANERATVLAALEASTATRLVDRGAILIDATRRLADVVADIEDLARR
jgi:gluconate kinase